MAFETLVAAGRTRVYPGGSFVAAKNDPGDWDGAFERAGVSVFRLDKAIVRGDASLMHSRSRLSRSAKFSKQIGQALWLVLSRSIRVPHPNEQEKQQ